MRRTTFEELPVAIARFQRNGAIVQKNSAFERLTPCEHLDDWIPGFSSLLSDTNGTHDSSRAVTLTARPGSDSPDSAAVCIEVLITKLPDDDEWAGAFARVPSRDRLGIGDPAFLNTLFHDLRSPLNAIIGFADLINRSPEASQQIRDHAQEVLDGAARQSGLVDRVLDLSRLATGKLALEEDLFTLAALITSVASRIEKEHPAKADWIDFQPPEPDVGVNVCADQGRLVVVLKSMLSHALDRVSEGPVIVDCRLDEPAESDGRLIVEVRFPAAMGKPGLDRFLAEYYALLMQGELAGSAGAEYSELRLSVPVRVVADSRSVAPEPVKQSISDLPRAQRAELAAAAASCDLDALMDVLEQISQRDEALAASLRSLARAYSYQELEDLVSESLPDAAKP